MPALFLTGRPAVYFRRLPVIFRQKGKASRAHQRSMAMLATKEEFERLIIDNQNFAYSVVNKEFSKYPWDIRQELNSAAIEGLVYAATKYDPKRKSECKFISYAVHWIRYYIQEQIRKLYPVRFNQNFVSKRNKVMKCVSDYRKAHNGEPPSVSHISAQVGMSERVVRNILSVNGGENFTFVSFNAPVETKDSESEQLAESKIIKEYFDSALDEGFLKRVEAHDILDNLKREVTPQEYAIFTDYCLKGESLTDLAKKYGMKFPSSIAYLIKKCEKRCRALAES